MKRKNQNSLFLQIILVEYKNDKKCHFLNKYKKDAIVDVFFILINS